MVRASIPQYYSISISTHRQSATGSGEHIYSKNFVFFGREGANFTEGQTAVHVDGGLIEWVAVSGCPKNGSHRATRKHTHFTKCFSCITLLLLCCTQKRYVGVFGLLCSNLYAHSFSSVLPLYPLFFFVEKNVAISLVGGAHTHTYNTPGTTSNKTARVGLNRNKSIVYM